MKAGPSRIIDGYILHEELGGGGMSTVYRASKNNVEVALKVVRPSYLARLNVEAKVLQGLNQENIVRYLGRGSNYLVLPLLQGVTVADFLNNGGEFSLEEIYEIILQLCEALTAVHAIDVIHRDIKPENLFILPRDTGGWQVIVIDFGIAKILEDTEELTNPSLMANEALKVVMGTPAYMSPEQAEGYALEPRSDMYAVGLIFVEMLLGQLREQDPDPLHALRMGEPLPARLAAILSPQIKELIEKMLARTPLDRPQAHEAAEKLRQLIKEAKNRSPVIEKKVVPPSPQSTPLPALLLSTNQLVGLGVGIGMITASLALMMVHAGYNTRPTLRARDTITTTDGMHAVPVNPQQRTRAHDSPPPVLVSPPRVQPAPFSCPRRPPYTQRLHVGHDHVPDREYWWNCLSDRRRDHRCAVFRRHGHTNDTLVQELCTSTR